MIPVCFRVYGRHRRVLRVQFGSADIVPGGDHNSRRKHGPQYTRESVDNFFGGVVMTVLGALGLLNAVMDFAGEEIVSRYDGRRGIFLGRVAFDLVKEERRLGAVSMVVAIAVIRITQDLVWR